MKKLFYMTLFVLTLMVSVVLADMGAPMINKYKATPRSVDGAPYYDYVYDYQKNIGKLEEVGRIPYGEIITIDFETTQDGENYGYLTREDAEGYHNYEVKLADLYVTNSDEEAPIHSDKTIKIKVLSNNLPIRKGPAYVYDVVGTIPLDVELEAFRIMSEDYEGNYHEDEMNPWLYVEYNGVSGWVCELNSALGQYVDKELMIKIDLSVSGDEIAIPANTIINGYYQTDMWSRNAYVSYEGKNYLISMYECAVDVPNWYGEGYEIKYNDAKIYSAASKESEVLLDSIPNGTILPVKYIEYDLRWIGWIYTEYNDVAGWVVYFEEEEALNQYLAGEYDAEGAKQGEAKIVETADLNDNEEQSENTDSPNNNASQENVIIPKLTIYIGIAIIIALTALVIILLINRKNNQ